MFIPSTCRRSNTARHGQPRRIGLGSISAQRTRRLGSALLIAFGGAALPSPAAASMVDCRDRVAVPLDRVISGFAATTEPAAFRLDVPEMGLLAIEVLSDLDVTLPIEIATATGSPIRWRALPLDTEANRRIVAIEKAGTLCLTVPSPGPNLGLFDLLAWLMPGPDRRPPVKDGTSDDNDSDDPPQEPVDEWIEIRVEPEIPATDETRQRWVDLPGFGVGRLQFDTPSVGGATFKAWSLCPTARPDLRITRSCARGRR